MITVRLQGRPTRCQQPFVSCPGKSSAVDLQLPGGWETAFFKQEPQTVPFMEASWRDKQNQGAVKEIEKCGKTRKGGQDKHRFVQLGQGRKGARLLLVLSTHTVNRSFDFLVRTIKRAIASNSFLDYFSPCYIQAEI